MKNCALKSFLTLTLLLSALAASCPASNLKERITSLYRDEKYEEAAQLSVNNLINHPDSLWLRLALAHSLAKVGQYSMASRHCEIVLDKRPTHKKALRLKRFLTKKMRPKLSRAQLLQLADKNRDACISPEELTYVIDVAYIPEILHRWDENKSLNLELSELKELPVQYLQERVKPIISIDINRDGVLSQDELLRARSRFAHLSVREERVLQAD